MRTPRNINAREQIVYQRPRVCSKKFVQQGHSHVDARSVLVLREHGNMARTPLAAFFNRLEMNVDSQPITRN